MQKMSDIVASEKIWTEHVRKEMKESAASPQKWGWRTGPMDIDTKAADPAATLLTNSPQRTAAQNLYASSSPNATAGSPEARTRYIVDLNKTPQEKLTAPQTTSQEAAWRAGKSLELFGVAHNFVPRDSDLMAEYRKAK